MASSLSKLFNNLSERIHKGKYVHDDKKCETCGIKHKYCDCFLEYKSFKDNLTECKCLCCNKIINKILMKSERNDFSMHANFITMITISLFYCCDKVFTLVNIWIIGKN